MNSDEFRIEQQKTQTKRLNKLSNHSIRYFVALMTAGFGPARTSATVVVAVHRARTLD
jgi:hypothetical protein